MKSPVTVEEALEIQVALGGRERLVIGGGFNTNTGRENARRGECDYYGVEGVYEGGKELIDWCEEHGLSYVRSFPRHEGRETWFHVR